MSIYYTLYGVIARGKSFFEPWETSQKKARARNPERLLSNTGYPGAKETGAFFPPYGWRMSCRGGDDRMGDSEVIAEHSVDDLPLEQVEYHHQVYLSVWSTQRYDVRHPFLSSLLCVKLPVQQVHTEKGVSRAGGIVSLQR